MLHFLFDFRGRVCRADLWKFSILAGLLQIGLIIAINQIYTPTPPPVDSLFDPKAWQGLFEASRFGSAIGRGVIGLQIAVLVLITIAFLAVSTKRLHDRDKRAWWLVPFWLLPQLCGVIRHTFFSVQPYAFIAIAIGLVAFAFGFWGFLEMLCFPGTIGENRFGPDTLSRPVINPFSGADTP
jgi:uncharacterized membrane protein YhaH (DUF805 family)